MANGILKKDYCLRNSDFDIAGRIKPSSVLDLFQDAASLHSEELGVGFEKMFQNNMLWVVIRVKYQVLRPIEMHQTVSVSTWPKEPKRIDFERDYLIEDKNGNLLVKGTSQWAVISSLTRKLTRADGIYKNIEGFVTQNAFEQKLQRVPAVSCKTEAIKVKSGYSELDCNGHVNNARYADYVLNALNPDKGSDISTFQLDFHKEIMLGDEVNIFVERNEDFALVTGEKNGETMFNCKIEVK